MAALEGVRRRMKDFPPLLSTMNGNRRLRFTMTKVRSDKGLLISRWRTNVGACKKRTRRGSKLCYRFEQGHNQLVHNYLIN
ncbi:hypothetical protein FF1_008073 [Malus domestica]